MFITYFSLAVSDVIHTRSSQIEGFRYRVADVSRAVTAVAVKEAIAKEVRDSILNSERLQKHFAEIPQDRAILEADKNRSHISKVQPHLKHVPGYLVPEGMKVHNRPKKRRRRGGGGTGERNTDNDALAAASQGAGEKRIFLNSQDGTGKSTSGRKAWKMARGKGKFSKRYDPTKHRGKR